MKVETSALCSPIGNYEEMQIRNVPKTKISDHALAAYFYAHSHLDFSQSCKDVDVMACIVFAGNI